MEKSDGVDQVKALRSLGSALCPACGGKKTPHQTLCRKDFMKLPTPQRQQLYRRTGEGYEQAVEAALNTLGVRKPKWTP